MSEGEDHFDSSRAELFEALGHPIRVKILRTLNERPMSFTELKRETGIGSSGHLQFHLSKLAGLIKTDTSGSYALTDEGREALHVAQAVLRAGAGPKKGGISARFVTAIVAVSTVWAVMMVAASIELDGTGFDSIVVILGGGFVACLLVLARLGQTSFRFDE